MDIISYYSLPRVFRVVKPWISKIMNMLQSNNKYTSCIYLHNFIFYCLGEFFFLILQSLVINDTW